MLLAQTVFVIFTAFAAHIVGANIVRLIIFLFFFSLLKRKKEAKKEKLSPTLVLHGNVSHERQRYFRYAKHKSPGGVVGGLSAVTLPFFLRFAGGKGSAASTPWANIVRPSPP